MAKLAPKEEKPYSPLDSGLIQNVVRGNRGNSAVPDRPKAETPPVSGPVVVQMPRTKQGEAPVVGEGGNPAPATTAAASEVPPQPAPRPQPQAMPVAPTRRDREKRMLLTEDEEEQWEQFVRRYAKATRTTIKSSHMLRAARRLLLNAESEILERARQSDPLKRPGNGDDLALEQFEKEIAQMMAVGISDAKVIR